MSKKCWYCEGTGKLKKPVNQEDFEKEFDRLDAIGQFNMHDCREKALDESGYTIVECHNCNGTGIES